MAKRDININVRAQIGQAKKALTQLERKVDKMGSGIETASKRGSAGFKGLGSSLVGLKGLFIAVTAGAFGIFIKGAVEAASKAEEVQNLFEVSFGEMAADAEEWALRTEAAIGVNDTTLKEFSGTLFNMTTSMGVTKEGAFALSTGLTQMALDAASFFNLPFEEAFLKFQSGLAGETEGLRRLGVDISETALKQLDFVKAIEATGRELTQAEKIQARAIAIAAGMKNAQLDLVRTSDSWANRTRSLGEVWTNFQELLGSKVIPLLQRTLLPVMDEGIQLVTRLVNAFSAGAFQGIADAFGLILGPVETFISIMPQLSNVVIAGFSGVSAALEIIGSGMKEDLNELGTLIGGLGPIFSGVVDSVMGNFPRLRGAFALWLADWKSIATGASLATDEQQNAILEAISSGKSYSDALAGIGKKTDETADSTDKMASITETYAKLMEALKGSMAGAGEGTDSLDKKTLSLARSMGTEGLLGRMDQMNAALGELARNSDQLSDVGLKKVNALIKTLEGSSIALTGRLEEIQKEQAGWTVKLNESAAGLDVVALNTGDWTERLDEGTAALDKNLERVDTAAVMNDALAKSQISLNEVIGMGTQLMGDIGNVLSIFGFEVDGVIGKITRLISSFTSLLGSVSSIIGAFTGGGGGPGLTSLLGGIGGGGGGGGGILGAIGGLLGGGGMAAGAIPASSMAGLAGAVGGPGVAAAGGGAGALGGIGSAISSGASAVMSGISTALAAVPVAGWIALAGIGVGALVKNIFGGPSEFEKAGGALADSFGSEFDESLRHHLVNVAESTTGGDFQEAIQRNLGEVMKRALEVIDPGELDALSSKIRDTFAFLERGELDAAEAADVLQHSVFQIMPFFDQLGEAGREALTGVVHDAMNTGVAFDGLRELAEALGIALGDELGAGAESASDSITDSLTGAMSDLDAFKDLLASIPTDIDVHINQIIDETSVGGNGNGIGNGEGIPTMQHGMAVETTSPTLHRFITSEHGQREGVLVSPGGLPGAGAGGSATNVTVVLNVRDSIMTGNAQEIAERLAKITAEGIRKNLGGKIQGRVLNVTSQPSE